MAEQWEYLSVLIRWDVKEKVWKAGNTKGQSEGEVLNAWSESGWECFNIVVAEYQAFDSMGYPPSASKWGSTIYTAFLKRRKP